ncbi:hypothetical protein BJ741DRAFT_367605 [Chytriomyces cf. hyalinus JEL632]|nr:hypothetical protein BJ741DRAFT_367605 [Chytriomyces cf. hyalinus JEL632]
MPFSFFISTTPEGDGLPITFTSPTASVTYAIRVKVSYTQPNTQFSTTSTYSAPVQVSPPWIAAPPPATPLLGPNEDGTRMVVDIMGSYQGRANLVRTGANRGAHQSGGLVSNRGSRDGETEESAYLRPRVLNNLIERRRPGSVSLRSFDGSGGDFGRIDVPAEAVQSYPASDAGLGMGRGHSIGVLEIQRDSGASQGASLLLNRSRSEVSYSPVSPNSFLGAQSDVYYSNRHTLEPFRDSDELALEVNSEAIVIASRIPPMEYAEMDPLAQSDSNRLAISPFSEASSAFSSSGFENSLVSANDQDQRHQNLNSGDQTGMGLHEQRPDSAATSTSRHPPLYPSTAQSSPVSSSPRSPTSMLKRLFKRVDRAKKASNQSSPNATGHLETPPSSSIPMLSPHPPQRTSVDIVADQPQRSSSPADSFLEYISAPIYDLPRFRVILPCTMVGPGSRVPIDVMVQSVPHGQVVAAVEAILVAQVTCTSFGYTHEELVELATVKEVESAVAEGPGLLFKKRMWIQVPDADVLKQYGSRFKVPLIELTHRMVINMYTTRRRIVGKGTKHEEYRLGSVSILLMR